MDGIQKPVLDCSDERYVELLEKLELASSGALTEVTTRYRQTLAGVKGILGARVDHPRSSSDRLIVTLLTMVGNLLKEVDEIALAMNVDRGCA